MSHLNMNAWQIANYISAADLASDFNTATSDKLVCDASGDSCHSAGKPVNATTPTDVKYTFD